MEFCFILLQQFAHVQEITLPQIYMAWHMLVCICHMESYLLTYLPTYLICVSIMTEMLM